MASTAHCRYLDKVVLVTGGTQGIGEGCTRLFVKHGAKVVFCAIGENAGTSLEIELNAAGPGEACYVACDVTNEEQIKNFVAKAVCKYDRIDCIINNAGAHPPFKPIDDFSADEFRKIIDLNLMGVFLTSKYALPHLRKTRGSVINIASLVATIGQAEAVTYCATKGAVVSLTKALAVDEARHHVRVNSISPGNIWTPMWDAAAQQCPDPAATILGGANAQLLGRFGTMEEAAQLCLYLAAEATFTTGIDIPLSGGAELAYGNKNRTIEKKSLFD